MIKSKPRSKKVSKRNRKPAVKRKASTRRRNPNPWEASEIDIDETKYLIITYLDEQIREYSREGGQGWALSFFEKLKKEVYAIKNENDLNNFLTTIAVKEMTFAKITDIVQED